MYGRSVTRGRLKTTPYEINTSLMDTICGETFLFFTVCFLPNQSRGLLEDGWPWVLFFLVLLSLLPLSLSLLGMILFLPLPASWHVVEARLYKPLLLASLVPLCWLTRKLNFKVFILLLHYCSHVRP